MGHGAGTNSEVNNLLSLTPCPAARSEPPGRRGSVSRRPAARHTSLQQRAARQCRPSARPHGHRAAGPTVAVGELISQINPKSQYSPPRDRAKERTNHTPPKSNSSVAEFDQNSDEPTTRKRGTPKSASPMTQHQMRRDRRPRNQPRSILAAERIEPPTPTPTLYPFVARSLTQHRRRRTARFDRGSSTHLAGRVRVTEARRLHREDGNPSGGSCAPPPSLASSRKRWGRCEGAGEIAEDEPLPLECCWAKWDIQKMGKVG